MSQTYRLPEGGRIDRSKPIRFNFNGKSLEGYEGDTLASALFANGVKLVGRSFKYHRPRGIMTAGSEEPNGLVQLGVGNRTEPNIRATQTEIFDGLTAMPQNCAPSLDFDITGFNQYIARFIPSGFYYKTFMYPQKLWMTYEHFIRNAAGMGKAPTEADPDIYAQHHAHCDVLVAGGGASGLAAALNAARTGARVILADEQAEFGGQLLGEDEIIDGKPGTEWVADVIAELKTMPEVTILSRTTVAGYFDYNFMTALERVTDHIGPLAAPANTPRQRFWKIRAKQVVLAQGAVERPFVFGDNDRPGVMLASSVRTYINRYGVLPGREMVIFTNNDNAYRTALAAKKAGATVDVVDIRKSPNGKLVQEAKEAGITIHFNSVLIGTRGKKAIHAVDIMELSNDGTSVKGKSLTVSCDCVAMSSGWNPTVHLFSQARGKLKFEHERGIFLPNTCQWPNYSVGAGNGSFELSDCLAEGADAGAKAAAAAGFGSGEASHKPSAAASEEDADLRLMWTVPSDKPLGRGRKHFVDHQDDVTASDVLLAHREGYVSVEHLKRYTTTGMGTDQGKTSNVNALAIMAHARGVDIPSVGTTTFRPPYTPVTFGAIAGQNVGDLFEQTRHTPMAKSAVEHGAVFEDVGDWKRAWYFPKEGENMHQAVLRECDQVRKTVGLFDASTLGKIDIQGKDAAWFLNMVYTNAWSKLGIGKCRYGLMLNEHGMIFDDGVTTRIGENHFHMTTTTGGAARVLNWLEMWHQTEWPDKEVYFTSVTEQWGVCALNGPNARNVLEDLTSGVDLSKEAFPFMSMQEMDIAGVPCRVYRISFTGEVAYEINTPARYGKHLYDALAKAGEKYDMVKYGTETMHVLRAEKGFIIVGQDTDGTVTPMDIGHDWIVSKKKGDFLGRRSFARSDTAREGRKQLVGILTEDPNVVLPEGAHLVSKVKSAPPMDMLGHVTSSYMSPFCGRSIALGLIKDGYNRIGESFYAPMMDGKIHKVTLTKPIFVDEEGVRARG